MTSLGEHPIAVETPWSTLGYLTYKRCVTVDTPVLTWDFKWVPAGELVEGQELLAFDENLQGSGRYLRKAAVVHNTIENAECLEIELESGEKLYCTPDHSWLVKLAGNKLEWREAKDLLTTKKHGPVYLPKVFGDVWLGSNLTYDDGYIAAALDGEGSLDRTNSFSFTQTDNEMLHKVDAILTAKKIPFKISGKSPVKGRKPCFDIRVFGMKNILQILGGLGSVRLARKLRDNLEKKPQRMRCSPEDMVKVVAVRAAGVRKIAVLQTTTATHFTAGYPSHNTYARRLIEDDKFSPTEEWADTVQRVVTAANEQLACGFTDDESQRLGAYIKGLKGSVAGRFLWQLGTTTVGRLGLASLQNCAFTTVDSPRAFTWAFDLLMLGSGVGYNIQREYVNELPAISESFKAPTRLDEASADFIVPDTREGWVALLERVLDSAFYNRGPSGFTYSCQLVRSKGAPIKGFGGTASGPEDLVWGIGQISKILEDNRGQKLRPIHCLDIMNIIGSVVVAGNVRRSAQIAIGDYDDKEYLNAKRWDLYKLPPWRNNSNNSVVCDDTSKLPEDFWAGYEGKGEPYGLINLALSRAVGRIGDSRYPDPNVQGYNPCAEQSLENYETCCLAEIFLPNIDSRAELLDVATLLYRVNKHSLALPCHLPETEQIVHKNMRMGIGITGYLQATEEQRQWLPWVYEKLREFDEQYSAAHGWPCSIKLTTCKPSGTLSLLPGVTPGVHPAYGTYLIRRIRIASDSPLVDVVKANGYKVEFARKMDGSDDHSTVVAEFPFAYPEGTPVAEQFSAIDQLEAVRRLNTDWSDNSVSCTVYIRPGELEGIKEYLNKMYRDNFKSLSFLLHSGHGFDQAPLEEISKEQYEALLASTTLITGVEQVNFDAELECEGGVCPVK